jgi:hypothetical protein
VDSFTSTGVLLDRFPLTNTSLPPYIISDFGFRMGKNFKKDPIFSDYKIQMQGAQEVGGPKINSRCAIATFHSIKLYYRDTKVLTCSSFFFIALQGKFFRLNKEKIISVNATYGIHSFFILLVVCNSDIRDQSAPSSNWRRG